mmetsp:Transcript_13514/g.34698  ORF Transcript_13514/g.34698 Transcript_13514/m.34698 type:complete len:211 (-) Transcript_13514:3241-3873(-)
MRILAATPSVVAAGESSATSVMKIPRRLSFFFFGPTNVIPRGPSLGTTSETCVAPSGKAVGAFGSPIGMASPYWSGCWLSALSESGSVSINFSYAVVSRCKTTSMTSPGSPLKSIATSPFDIFFVSIALTLTIRSPGKSFPVFAAGVPSATCVTKTPTLGSSASRGPANVMPSGPSSFSRETATTMSPSVMELLRPRLQSTEPARDAVSP